MTRARPPATGAERTERTPAFPLGARPTVPRTLRVATKRLAYSGFRWVAGPKTGALREAESPSFLLGARLARARVWYGYGCFATGLQSVTEHVDGPASGALRQAPTPSVRVARARCQGRQGHGRGEGEHQANGPELGPAGAPRRAPRHPPCVTRWRARARARSSRGVKSPSVKSCNRRGGAWLCGIVRRFAGFRCVAAAGSRGAFGRFLARRREHETPCFQGVSHGRRARWCGARIVGQFARAGARRGTAGHGPARCPASVPRRASGASICKTATATVGHNVEGAGAEVAGRVRGLGGQRGDSSSQYPKIWHRNISET